MTKQLTKPFNPIIWPAVPRDLITDSNIGYATDDTIQRYTFGTRAMTWDGSILRYTKAGSTYTSYDLAVWSNATAAGISFESISSASAKGEKIVRIAEGSVTENQYAGGYLLLFHATGGGKMYTVIGNSESSGGLVTLYIDQPLGVAVTTSDSYELYASPYTDVQQGNAGGTHGFVGIPMALVTSGSHGWTKTWGPVFIAPQSSVGGAYTKACYFRHDGSIDIRGNIGSPVTDQLAGYTMVGSAAGDGPIVMLQVAIQKGLLMTMIKDGKRVPPKEVEEMAKKEAKKK